MQDAPRQKLAELVAGYGRQLGCDPDKCRNLLKDVCPTHRRETRILVEAIRENIVAELLDLPTGVPVTLVIARLTTRLVENCGIRDDLARWCVRSWVEALGIPTWHRVQGHEHIVERFRRAIRRGRLASTFLFVGPPGIGKHTFALHLAQSLLCRSSPEDDLEPCGHCSACLQVEARTHPDLLLVSKPEDKNFIPLELLIGDWGHRGGQGLCYDIWLRPFHGGRKIAIIDGADFLNPEGASCLLRTLEEPPPKSMFILIGTSEHRQRPTIRSRCQIMRFRPLSKETVARLLVSKGLVDGPHAAARLAASSEGSMRRALDLADGALAEFRASLLAYLSDPHADFVEFAKTVGLFVDQVGREASPRRARMTQIIGMASDFYWQLMRCLAGLPIEGDETLVCAVQAAYADWPGDEEAAAACIERSLDAQRQVEAIANQATLIDCWLDDLAAIARTGRSPTLVGI